MCRLTCSWFVLGAWLWGCGQNGNGDVVGGPPPSRAPVQMDTAASTTDAGPTSPVTPGEPDDPAGFGHEAAGLLSCGFGDPFLTCDQSTSVCCVGAFDADTVTCVPGPYCGMAGNEAACDGPEDCDEDEVCCVDTVAGTNLCERDSCKSGQLRMCHTEDDCAPGDSCDVAPEFTWWGYCA